MTPAAPCPSVASDSAAAALFWPSDPGAEAAAAPQASASIGALRAAPPPCISPLTSQELARLARACAAFGFDARSARQYSLLGRLAHHAAKAGCDGRGLGRPLLASEGVSLPALEQAFAQARRLLRDLAAAAYRLRAARVRLQTAQRELVTTHAYARCIGVMLAAWSDASCVRRRWHDSERALALARLRAAADGAVLALLNERADALLSDARHAGLAGRPAALPPTMNVDAGMPS